MRATARCCLWTCVPLPDAACEYACHCQMLPVDMHATVQMLPVNLRAQMRCYAGTGCRQPRGMCVWCGCCKLEDAATHRQQLRGAERATGACTCCQAYKTAPSCRHWPCLEQTAMDGHGASLALCGRPPPQWLHPFEASESTPVAHHVLCFWGRQHASWWACKLAGMQASGQPVYMVWGPRVAV